MNEEDIINYWKQGYSVDQITEKSVLVEKNKGKDGEKDAKYYVKRMVEETILKYQS